MEFQTIRHLMGDGLADSVIPPPNVTSRILSMAIDYCKKHVEASKGEEEEKEKDKDDLRTWNELVDLIRQFVAGGSEGSTLLLQTCLDKVNGGDTPNLQLRLDLLSAVFKYLLARPNFCTIFCQALLSTSMSDGFLEYVSNTLNLSLSEKIGVGLALFESDYMDLRTKGQSFCIGLIEDLIANSTTPAVSHELIQDIILFLYRSEGLSTHVDYFTKLLSLVPHSGSSFFTQAPILTDDESNSPRQLDLFYESPNDDFESVLAEIEKEMSMADIVRELGYGCTVSTSHCKEILSLFLPLHESTLAKLLGTIAYTHIGLDDTQNTYLSFCSALGSNSPYESSLPSSWNIDVLVDSIKQIVPETNWTHVMEKLDHEGFNIADKASFSLMMSIYSKACGDPFPLHAICGCVWKNAEGQLSFLKHAVGAPSDVFTFAHCSRQLDNADMAHLSKGSGNQAWSCLDLLDVLCQLAERGYISSIRLMLEAPLKECPEVLLIGIAHVNTAYNLLQYEVFSTVFPVILNDSTKNSVIHHLWEVNANLVLRGFIDAHTDPNSLFRILDICQEMKILSSVLDASPFIVSFGLAACAYRKELTNLEKWLNESLTLFKDAFFGECVAFLKEILSEVKIDVPDSIQQSRLPLLNVYQETFPTFFKVLQTYSGQLISREVLEEFKRLHDLPNSKIQRPVAVDISISDESPDDIEREANAYFHQMFSGILTIDAMVQMLARFKKSSEKREQLIFDCMITNLFEESKFFPKFPDRQLKLAAILWGSLIKNQLVTRHHLGIALRLVLDALRKSVDSKMFMFGTNALEQFIEHVVEWPQYCNHILQISHLRSSHAELVSVIERALARTSSSQAASDGGNSLPTDQQQGSMQASVESMEASEASWQFIGSSSSSQSGEQLSPFQLQQKHQGFLGDRLKQNTFSNTISLISNTGQFSLTSTPVDSISKPNSQSLQIPSPQHSAGVPATVSSSPGFLRPSRSMTPAGMLRQHSYSTGFGAALNIETLVAAAERRDTPIEAPASEVQDKILFMINNLSTANIEAKAKEFTDVINEQYYPWFAQYMVMKRASIEPNFHDLYLKFIDKVNSKSLNKDIVKATYENCKVLLRSDLIKSSSEERSLLKNLGSWLGKFTIGRNQALRAKEIDPKALIIEAYEKGLMIAVIPFTSKVLEPCQSSLAYKPPNPWTMGILGLLVEIYNLPNLKMNLKFDIEVLFKNLGVDMKDVKPTSLLKDRVREVEGNPDFSSKDISVSQAPVIAEVSSGVIPAMNQVELQADVNNSSHPSSHPNVLAQYASPLHHGSNTIVEDEKVGPLIILERLPSAQGLTQVTQSPLPFSLNQLLTMTPRYDSHININPKLNQMIPPLQIHRFTKVALDKAIKDIVLPVIQRSVTIASRTTKELVLKDYAMESDDGAISRAAHLMVGTLAGSLAHVTCKEPLRAALLNHLHNLILTLNLNGDMTDRIVQIITNDNIDLGCAVIEHVASEKAVELIDGEIGPSFAAIRKLREGAGTTYYDASTYAQGPFARVPEALRPKPGRLSVAQQRVYNDFVRNVWQNQSNQSSSVVTAGSPSVGGNSVNSSMTDVYGSSSNQLNSNIFTTSQVAPGFSAAQELDLIQEDSDRGSTQLGICSNTVGPDEGVIQSAVEISSIVPSSAPTVASPDIHSVETSSVSEDVGALIQLSTVTPGAEHMGTASAKPFLTIDDVLDKYQLLAHKLEAPNSKDDREAIQVIIAEVPNIILRCVSRDEAGLAVAQKVFKSLYDNASSPILIAAHLAILSAIRDVCKLVVKELTSWVRYSDEERGFNKEIILGFIQSELLNIAEYDVHLAKLIDGGRNKTATEFAISLVQALVGHEPGVSTSEFYNVIDTLAKLAMRAGSPESLQQLIEIARNSTANATSLPGFTANKEDKSRQSRDTRVISGRIFTNRDEYNVNEPAATDPTGLYDQVSRLFAEWCRICELPATNDTTYSHYISQLQQSGLLNVDDITDRFFRILTELSVAYCFVREQVNQQLQHLSFVGIDAYAKLVVLVLKYFSLDQGSSKIELLTKILSVTVRVIHKDAEEKGILFNPRPYFRLFVNWLLDLTSSDAVLDGSNFQVLTSLAAAFHALQPLKAPGFSFAWLELVSHRSFMPKLITSSQPKGWSHFQRLLVDLLKFMEPYLRNAALVESVQYLYKGTMRVLLVLLHDFPEFLCEYHFSFCDVIPHSCIQMRNVILSAFPRNMRLPDPSTPNLKIDLLAEIRQPPRILSDVEGALKAKQLKVDIDEYMQTKPEGSPFLSELKQRLLLSQSETILVGTRYNIPLINSLVLYVGMQAIHQLQNKPTPPQQMTNNSPLEVFLVSAAMDIFQTLLINLDSEGRYYFLNAVANQLRYPNNHTHYFSFVLLFLFVEASQEIFQEQITRVLLERLIVNRPHPWGLLITFIELIKNPRYKFWNRSFTRCAPEIERLFESVSRSCGGPKTVDDGMGAGGMPDGSH